MKTYAVDVVREDDAWIADVDDLPGAHTYGRTLAELRPRVEEVIRLVADLPDSDPLRTIWRWRNVDQTVLSAFELGDQHREIERQERERLAAASVVAQRLVDLGWSVREIGAMLELSPARISQLTRPRASA